MYANACQWTQDRFSGINDEISGLVIPHQVSYLNAPPQRLTTIDMRKFWQILNSNIVDSRCVEDQLVGVCIGEP